MHTPDDKDSINPNNVILEQVKETYSTNPTSNAQPIKILINNADNIYYPIRLQRCGVVLMCRPDVLVQCPTIIQHLQSDVLYCLHILPISVRSLIRRTRIWINLSYCYGRYDQPTHVNHTTTHHHEAWLLCARDRPDKACSIEIYNAYDYIRMRHHWNGSGLLLHEYCHLIHQHVFGLDNVRIRNLYETIHQSTLYQHVLRRDWADKGNGNDTDLAYCTIDCKEFFAEMSVTYMADSFHHLDNKSCNSMIDSSPPITEPTVLKRLRDNNTWKSKNTNADYLDWIKTIKTLLAQMRQTPHCNKFYPFTSGQLRHYDPILYDEIKSLWCEVLHWEDPNDTEAQLCATCDWMKLPERNDEIINSKQAVLYDNVKSASQFIPLDDTVDL